MNSGQSCVAQTRILASRRYNEVGGALAGMQVGDPADQASVPGPTRAELDSGVAPLDHGVGQAKPTEHLQSSRLHSERPGFVDPVALAVDEPGSGAGRVELRRQGQSGRAGADNQNVDPLDYRSSVSAAGLRALTKTDQKLSATMWLSTISMSVNPASTSWVR
jgi:hypothetical protein